jgi:hypothetical protein
VEAEADLSLSGCNRHFGQRDFMDYEDGSDIKRQRKYLAQGRGCRPEKNGCASNALGIGWVEHNK